MELPADEDLIAEAITEAFGERCPDFEPECHCCKVWKQYDHLVSATERAAKIAQAEKAKAIAIYPVGEQRGIAVAVADYIYDAIRSQP